MPEQTYNENLVKFLYVKLWRIANNTLSFMGIIIDILKHYKSDVIRKYWYQYFPEKPRALIYVCNKDSSQPQHRRLSVSELTDLLQTPLFSKIQSVNIAGDEITWLDDLPLLFDTIYKSFPKLQRINLVTSTIKELQATETINALYEVCTKCQVTFSFKVSLNSIFLGDNHQHDQKNDFNAMVNILQSFRGDIDIPFSVNYTITKNNIWRVDELLELFQKEKIHIIYGLADFLNPLDNSSQVHETESFTPDENYQLALFFTKLELDYEKDVDILRSYRSMRKIILKEAERSIPCPRQSSAVVLDGYGNLQYCESKSKIIGNGLQDSPLSIWRGNLKERRRMLKENCGSCPFHDYADITSSELVESYLGRFWRKSLSFEKGLNLADKVLG